MKKLFTVISLLFFATDLQAQDNLKFFIETKADNSSLIYYLENDGHLACVSALVIL